MNKENRRRGLKKTRGEKNTCTKGEKEKVEDATKRYGGIIHEDKRRKIKEMVCKRKKKNDSSTKKIYKARNKEKFDKGTTEENKKINT